MRSIILICMILLSSITVEAKEPNTFKQVIPVIFPLLFMGNARGMMYNLGFGKKAQVVTALVTGGIITYLELDRSNTKLQKGSVITGMVLGSGVIIYF